MASVVFVICIMSLSNILLLVKSQESSIRDGTYIISSAIKGKNNEEFSLYVEGSLSSKKLSDVTLQKYTEGSAPFHWTVKKKSWLSTLIPASNPRNIVSHINERGTSSEFEFNDIESTKFRIQRIIGRSSPRCLKNNGVGKAVSLVGCGNRQDRYDPSLLWEFKIVSPNARP